MLLLSSFVVSSFLLVASAPVHSPSKRDAVEHPDIARFQSLWAQFAPYTPADTYAPPPAHCTINQVHLVQRHGSRYPEMPQNKGIKTAVEKLKKILDKKKISDQKFDFLSEAKYKKHEIGPEQEGKLTPLGEKESYESGLLQYSRYKALFTSTTSVPLVHSSSVPRVVISAENWIKGFEKLYGHNIPPPELIEKQTKWDLFTAVRVRQKYYRPWMRKYLPEISKTLSAVIGTQLSKDDVYYLMLMCPLETGILRQGDTSSKTLSPFCNIFTEEQFKDFAWQGALNKYYIGKSKPHSKYGLSPDGYAEALYTRLSSTKKSDPSFYADFSHDNEMAGILNELGLFRQAKDLSLKKRDDSSDYKASALVPFAGRIVLERMTCETSSPKEGNEEVTQHGPRIERQIQSLSNQQFVRVLVNDALQPLKWCGAEDGMCKVAKFVKGPDQKAS
ncbi:histidine phosphatase superfamily [Rhodocollybia butyracea]|uniref:Phytase A n=1 Tax=Rhodocollybia butyracea TaxID=206335 RepID=A0A9P5TXD6_9AGAR|nr:histidine phosphatase superfamily [Rhodocollybia butyracea]